jgi:hypothetical protein
MKKLLIKERKQIIEELTAKFLDREQLVSIIRKLGSDSMYIKKRKALEIPVDFVTYNGQENIKALINSRATNNFIDIGTVDKLKPGMQEIAKPRQVYNIDGTSNQAGLIEQSVHLYIEKGEQKVLTQFFITSLG